MKGVWRIQEEAANGDAAAKVEPAEEAEVKVEGDAAGTEETPKKKKKKVSLLHPNSWICIHTTPLAYYACLQLWVGLNCHAVDTSPAPALRQLKRN